MPSKVVPVRVPKRRGVHECAVAGGRRAKGSDWSGQICTTPSVLNDSITAKVTREVAASDSMLTGEPEPDSKQSITAFISAACPFSPEKDAVDFFRPTAHSSFLKFHNRAVFWSPKTSRYSFSTALAPFAK